MRRAQYVEVYVTSISLEGIRHNMEVKVERDIASDQALLRDGGPLHPDVRRSCSTPSETRLMRVTAWIVATALRAYMGTIGCPLDPPCISHHTRYPKKHLGQVRGRCESHSFTCLVNSVYVPVRVRSSMFNVDICVDLPQVRCGFLWLSKTTPPVLTSVVCGHISAAVPALIAAIRHADWRMGAAGTGGRGGSLS